MLVDNKPSSKTLEPKNLYDIICGGSDKNIYVIENLFQRELVWDFGNIDTYWNDLMRCIKENIDNPENDETLETQCYTSKYLEFGSLEYSDVDDVNISNLQPLPNGLKYKSLVDGSQRVRISFFMALALCYYEQIDFENLNLSRFKANGQFKVIEISTDEYLRKFLDKLENTPMVSLKKELNKLNLEKLSNEFSKEDERRDYFRVFALFVKYIERDIIGKYELSPVKKIALKNVVFYEEFFDKAHKFSRFVDRNKKGNPMTDESMYPKFIINSFLDKEGRKIVYDSFKRFEEKAEAIQNKAGNTEGTFRQTKKGVRSTVYIMIEVLKILLGEKAMEDSSIELKKIFTSSFDLANIDYGIEKCFDRKLIFNTPEDGVNYFNLCSEMADFLDKESFTRHEGSIYEDCYYLRDFSTANVLWWYYIKPCFLAYSRLKDTNWNRFVFVKKVLYALYCFYIVHRAGSTNSQNLINLLELISSKIITFEGSNEEFEQVIRSDASGYIETSGGYDKLEDLIRSLSYTVESNRNAIENIFLALEYDMHEKYNIPTDYLFRLWKRQKMKKEEIKPDGTIKTKSGISKIYNLDHWYPIGLFEKLEGVSKTDFQRIGNLVILEDGLNKSKQDRMDLNDDIYGQSSIVQTKLMNNKKRGVYSNKDIDALNNYKYLPRYSAEEINNPTSELINNRTELYVEFFVNFIKGIIENKG